MLADCIRYLLIRTSINGIAGNYVPKLVAQAVKTRYWTVQRALSVAEKIPDEAKRVEMWTAILGIDQLSEEQQREAQVLGWQAALALPDAEQRAGALAALAPQLTSERRRQVLERALEATLALPDAGQRAKALAALAPQLTGELLERALEATLALPVDWVKRAEALAALAPQLTSERRHRVLKRALEAALALPNWAGRRAKALAALAPRLTGELLERALEAALALPDAGQRAKALAALAPRLTGEPLERALKAALALPEDWDGRRARALTVFLPLRLDQTLLLRSIRQTMVDNSWSIQHLSRGDVLSRYFIKEVFAPPVFSSQTLGVIASHVIEICEEWRWL